MASRSRSLMRWFDRFVRWGTAVVLITASVLKFRSLDSFVVDIAQYQIIGEAAASFVAVAVCWIELVIGIGLVVPGTKEGGRWLAVMLLLGFTGVVLSAVVRGIDIDCGCYGELGMGSSAAVVMRNLVIAAGLVFAWWLLQRQYVTPDDDAAPPPVS